VKSLTINYKLKKGNLRAVEDLSFLIQRGENLGIVGESGCGKSTTAKAIMRLLPENGQIISGNILYKGADITKFNKEKLRKWRWNEVSLITQSAMNALDPVYCVEDQIKEALLAHKKINREEARNKIKEVFNIVGLGENRLKAYPHEMSGGMRQRAIIAMAIILNPSLIIADEPTTALDVIVQDGILNKIIEIQQKMNSSIIFITHDMSVVAETCQRVCIMYGGKVMELGSTLEVFKRPRHPYTMGLKNAFPNIKSSDKDLISIPGQPPNLINPPKGCRFAKRCPFSTDRCFYKEPPLIEIENDHSVRCHYFEHSMEFRETAKNFKTWNKVKEKIMK